VCEGCGSIVLKKALLCPNCHAYRFDESVSRVKQQAEVLGSRDAASVTKDDYN
jgi:precorrin-6B methylase 2